MANYISVDNNFDEVKKKNFFFYCFAWAFVWMCFHFTLVYFFMIKLESLLLVWLFLWFWNLISFLSDSPIWVIQKYFNAKKIFLFGSYLMLIVSIIFVYFIYNTNLIELNIINLGLSVDAIKIFLWSIINIILLLFTVTLYWIIKEISEVTSYSYIMNRTDPSEYSSLFSKRNIYIWLWSLVWLIISWIILALDTLVAVIILVIIIILFIWFTYKYLDSSENEIKFDDLKNIKLITKDDLINSIDKYKTTFLSSKNEIIEKTKNLKVLFIKPIQIKHKFTLKELYITSIKDLKIFYYILFKPPYNNRLLFMWLIFTIFWFWDTFVTSFLIDYIDQIIRSDNSKYIIKNIVTAYSVIAIFAIPAYWLQIPFIKLWTKIWIFKMTMIWLLISWISLFLFWVTNSLLVILIIWIINSVWYAASMPLSQWEFSIEYNNTYSEKNNLKQIDSNASSSPIKMIWNLANVFWLFLGWILLWAFWYNITFFVFGFLLIFVFIFSLIKREKYKLK